MHILHTIVYILGVKSVKDTQCGFKLFTRKAAQFIFPNINTKGWIFDIEILILAEYMNIPVKEVPVNWSEIEGSKVQLVKDSIKMLIDLFLIRFSYSFGYWKYSIPTFEQEDAINETSKPKHNEEIESIKAYHQRTEKDILTQAA